MNVIRNLLKLPAYLLTALLILLGCGAIGVLYLLALVLGFIIVPALALLLISYLGIRYRGLRLVRYLWMLRLTLPSSTQEIQISGLKHIVKIEFDQYGIPFIHAFNLTDAVMALGYATARDRMFQMDIARREAAGRLSELFGLTTILQDIASREIGFGRAGEDMLAHLPGDQQELLDAYSIGVNSWLMQSKYPGFEFLALGYQPEPWTAKDSLLVAQGLFKRLCADGSDKRMFTIMERVLPKEVVEFLTPEEDIYQHVLGGGPGATRPLRPLPVAAMQSVRRPSTGNDEIPLVRPGRPTGSNNFAVAGSHTYNGSAVLANDIHLDLNVPNIWYRASISTADCCMSGVTIPGLPLIIVGSTKNVSWGMTRLCGDCLDLVKLELHPEDPDCYLTPDGWQRFGKVRESIKIKGGYPLVHEVRTTIWGPVCAEKLMGDLVALRWTALEPGAVDIGLAEICRAENVEAALNVAGRAGCPPLNIIVADSEGHIGWTASGRIPVRKGFDGNGTISWASGDAGWMGYIPAKELPRVVDPPEGYLVTANQRVVGSGYPYRISSNYYSGHRAWWITHCLSKMKQPSEATLFKLQLDTRSHFYEFYRELALELLNDVKEELDEELSEAKEVFEAWDGKADISSNGLALLILLRQQLLETTLAPFLRQCREHDSAFVYCWHNPDSPLRILLQERPPELIPEPEQYDGWSHFILRQITLCVRELKTAYRVKHLSQLHWGQGNRASITHSLSWMLRPLRALFDMPRNPLPGCEECICVSHTGFGASVRMVVSPSHQDAGILHMPGGQSGHALSSNYADQHPAWVAGTPLAFLPGPQRTKITLTPPASEMN